MGLWECGIFNTKSLTKKQKMKYVRSKYQITKYPKADNWLKYARNDVAEKIIKNCRVVKRCKDGLDRKEKEN